MMGSHSTHPRYRTAILLLVAMPVLYYISRHNYNLFHSIVDGTSIVIAASVFVIIWNVRRIIDNEYFLYVGISFLFFAFFDSIHVLGNKNMGVFPEYGNLGPALYIASRYILSISLLIAPLFINRKLNSTLMFAGYSLITLFILLSIFHWQIFPVCIVEGVGLTPFKVISDYVICFIFLGAIGLLLIRRRSFDPRMLRIMVSSIILFIATGVAFTLYADPFGIMNAVGHFLQIASFYLVYLAIIETSLTKPQDVLYRKLKQSEEKLAENVERLDHANLELKQEIAERKRTEEELRRSREWLRVTLESIGDAVLATDTKGRVVFLNPIGAALTGWEEEDARGKTIEEVFRIINEKTRKPAEDIVRRVLREGKVALLANHTALVARDGREISIEDSAAPIRGLAGELAGVVLVFRDVTEKRKEQEALREARDKFAAQNEKLRATVEQLEITRHALAESEQKYRIMGEILPYGVWLCDAEGKAEHVSRSFLELINMSMEEMKGFGWSSRLVPEDVPAMMEKWLRCVRTGAMWDEEHRIIDRHGKIQTILTRGLPVRDKAGSITGWAGINLDITERKKMEEELRKARDELELRVEERTEELRRAHDELEARVEERTAQLKLRTGQLEAANKELESFSYSVSHDLRSPLRAITGFTGMVKEDLGDRLDGDTKRKFDVIQQNAERMGQLIDDLLAFSRLGRTTLKLSVIDMKGLTEAVIEELKTASSEKMAEIAVHDLPVSPGDPVLIRQVLSNLIGNAVKFTKGEEKPRIDITGYQKCDENIYCVKDNGVGFDMNYYDKLFGVFQRLHSATEFDGTGVGLAIVHRIITSHGGRVWAEGKVNAGASFYFTLPEKNHQAISNPQFPQSEGLSHKP